MRWVLRRGVAADGLDADVDPAAFAVFAALLLVFGLIFAAHGAALALLLGQRRGIDARMLARFVAMRNRRAIIGGGAVPRRVALRRVGAGWFYA